MTANNRRPLRPWLRLLGQGLVIVFSILLAFWIDAAWDVHKDRARTRDHLRAVRAEFHENSRILDEAEANCADSWGANTWLIRLMRPDPEPISADSLSSLIHRIFMGTPVELGTAALDALIAAGEFAEIASPELQRGLTGWLAGPVAERRRVTALYAAQMQKTIDALQEVMPFEHVVASDPALGMPPSGFPADVRRVLASPRIEGELGNLGVLKSFLCRDDQGYREEAETLVRLLEAEVDE